MIYLFKEKIKMFFYRNIEDTDYKRIYYLYYICYGLCGYPTLYTDY